MNGIDMGIHSGVPVAKFKRTKILATIGPSSNSYDSVLAMLRAGVNGFRLNFSHGTFEERAEQIGWIRQASQEYGKPVAIVADLQGPKIRLGDFEGVVPVQKDQELQLEYKADYEASGRLPLQYDLSKKVKKGERLLIADGRLRTTVRSVKEGVVKVVAENEGVLTKRKGINLPDTDLGGDIITKKDRADIVFALEHDVDYLALSFVQTGEDIVKLRHIIKNNGSDARIIAKIETQAATEHLDEIVAASDAVMVARGDLAIEVSSEAVPVLQRLIVGKCMERGKISIVATQMLASMTTEPEPSRAEASDVATAVFIGADCLMLSDETASGKYPVDAVKTMKRIVLYAQNNSPLRVTYNRAEDVQRSPQFAVCLAAITLAARIQAVAIVAETQSGRTALDIASLRPVVPMFVIAASPRVAQQLSLMYGSKTFVREPSMQVSQKLTTWLRERKVFHRGDVIVSVSGQHPGQTGGTDTIKMRVLE